MKKTLILTAAGLVLAAAGSALANGVVRVEDASNNYNGTDGSGGAFVLTQTSGYVGTGFGQQGLGANQFHSFCLEVGEFISFGSSFYAEIASSAKAGGSGTNDPSGTDSGPDVAGEDQLSFVTAKIYSEFRANGTFGGALAGGLDSSADATAIQQAIWYSEGEIGSVSGDAQAIFNWASANHGGTLGNVRVLRLYNDTNNNGVVDAGDTLAQDQLTLIPLPTAGGLACAGLALVSVRRRRSV